MKTIEARVNVGESNNFATRRIELHTVEEAKQILKDKNWEVEADIYSTTDRNRRIGWFAKFTDVHDRIDGIFVEASR